MRMANAARYHLKPPCSHDRMKSKEAIILGGRVTLIEVTCVQGHVWVERLADGQRKVVKIKHG